MSALWQKIRRYRYGILAVVLLLIVSKVAYSYFATPAKTTQKSQTVTVERGELVSTVSATGTIKPVNMVDISSKISGLVKEVKVNENDQVQAGQILLTLDDTHLQALVSQARSRLALASANVERSEKLHAIGAVSDQQLDAERTDYNVAQASYADATAQLADTVIRTPINGKIIGKPIPAGQAVAPGISSPMVLMTVADLSNMQIETQVDESDIGKIQLGQTVTFTVDAYPGKTFRGKVANISAKANVQQNVVYYSVLVDVDTMEDLLRPTMTARVSIQIGSNKNALLLPLSAVKSNNGQQYVVVMNPQGKNENVAVTTGLMSEDKVEILSGLSEGDTVLLQQTKPQTASSSTPAGASGMFRGLGR